MVEIRSLKHPRILFIFDYTRDLLQTLQKMQDIVRKGKSVSKAETKKILISSQHKKSLSADPNKIKSDIPEAHQKLVLARIRKIKQNPSKLIDWEKGSKMLKS